MSDREALRAFVSVVNAYTSFAGDTSNSGKTISNDDATFERHAALSQAIRDRYKAALVAGFRLGQPQLQMEATLKQCIDLCVAYACYWVKDKATPHPLRKLLNTLSEPLATLEMLIAAAEKPAAPAGGKPSATAKPSVGRKASINTRMIDTIQTNPEAMGWSSPKWARQLKCAKSSIVVQPTWKDLTMRRDRDRAERAMNRHRRPKPRS